jgi:MoxR-like ATPase
MNNVVELKPSSKLSHDVEYEAQLREKLEHIKAKFEYVVVGLPELRESILLGLMTENHILAQGDPGTGKTLSAKTLGVLCGLSVIKITGKADTLPQQILGYRDQKGKFHYGHIFKHVVILDEANRFNTKATSPFIEAMEERELVVEDMPEPLPLPRPWLVIATMNLQDSAAGVGTYDVGAALYDRYGIVQPMEPSSEDELAAAAVRDTKQRLKDLSEEVVERGSILSQQEFLHMIDYIGQMASITSGLEGREHPIVRYLARLVLHIRELIPKDQNATCVTERGIRSAWVLLNGLRLLEGKDEVTQDMVHRLLPRCWAHRLGMTSYTEEEAIIRTALDDVPFVPKKEVSNAKLLRVA